MADPQGGFSQSITYKLARRIAVAVIGGTVCLIGMAMIVLPGPAMIVIPLGLGILGLEFAWARRWLRNAKEAANGIADGVGIPASWRKPLGRAPTATDPGEGKGGGQP
ncbi:MAG: TerC/Alx family metal homeostasis rane protein [Proteobacteria bacterium]|nr:TerC/Alx family metal homeostasis rane protein [Pseudomonadota bacterium]